jgi:shikimate kinase
MGKFYPQFDHIILLSAPAAVIVERLASRTNNPYGKHPDEAARMLSLLETVEPLLRNRAEHEVDTSAPLDQVVVTILRLVQP